jgi:hypothetical protein
MECQGLHALCVFYLRTEGFCGSRTAPFCGAALGRLEQRFQPSHESMPARQSAGSLGYRSTEPVGNRPASGPPHGAAKTAACSAVPRMFMGDTVASGVGGRFHRSSKKPGGCGSPSTTFLSRSRCNWPPAVIEGLSTNEIASLEDLVLDT